MSEALRAHNALARMRMLGDIALAPDGSAVAFTAADHDGAGSPVVNLLDLAMGTAEPRSLLPTGVDTGTAHGLPRWLPDSRHLLLAAAGPGGELDRVMLTDTMYGEITWSIEVSGAVEDAQIDAGEILCRVADPGSERDGMHLGLRTADHGDPFVRSPGSRRRRLVRARVGHTDIRTIDLGELTVWDCDWDGDGLAVAVVSADESPAGFYRPSLVAIDLDSGHVRHLYSTPWQLSRVRLAPDRASAVVIEGLSIVSGQVLRVDLHSGSVRGLGTIDDVTDLGWLDGDRLWFVGWSGLGCQGGVLHLDGRLASHWVSSGTFGGRDGQPSLSVNQAGTMAATVWETPGQPPEVAVASLTEGDWQVRTRLNQRAATLDRQLRHQELYWSAPDGTEIRGLLLRPTGDGPFPLVVIAHGGPTWLWSSAFAPGESNQLALPLAIAGAAVLLPNPRGSSGRGQEYARMVIGHVGDEDLDDVLSGVDQLVADGIADADRLAIMGLSYGGYLTAQALTRTTRFRAAVVMSGVSDWLSFHTTSNLGGGYDHLYHVSSDPATSVGREFLAARSPVYHAAAVTTPTLILHGQDDRVTPVGQAEQLYHAWSRAGVPVELVIYPREGHELVEPAHRADAAERVLDWLNRFGVIK
ncbi:S9 family peptidase [Micromonospora sp. CPCC 206060]|uniref:alpha/beta hydrolase family protein n=1 Tax=Micromonospora sp. CPCC 206060 TaxID=3122406 RepID=UPI002FEF38A0